MIILASFAWLMWGGRDAAVRATCSIRVADLEERLWQFQRLTFEQMHVCG